MKCRTVIENVHAREILDSRGNPTIEAMVTLTDGSVGVAAAPSGASTGKYEAHELRDRNSKRYMERGVLSAVENVNGRIAEALHGLVCDTAIADSTMLRLDGSENKSVLGANAILSVSLACAKAAAKHYRIPLYRYIGGISGAVMPIPMMNILNGGAHAANNLDIQEFMIMPIGFGTFSEALRAGCEIYHTLGRLLKNDGHITTVGDEGGFAPNLKNHTEALDYIMSAIDESGYTGRVKLALDAAASEWAVGEEYVQPKSGKKRGSDSLISEWRELVRKYPIISLEDGLGEDDHNGWSRMTETLGDSVMLVGDDYFVTNPKKLIDGIKNHCGNSILIKPNQIGTITETIEVIRCARRYGYKTIISHRSGETSDTTIADIAVGMNAGFIKTGATARSERCEKYNRLLRIEEELGCGREYYGTIEF